MSRWADLTRLGYGSYDEYLDSGHWQGVRRRYRESGRSMDCVCGEPSAALHHQTYERIGREELDDLVPLCGRCHATVHDLERRGLSGLAVDALRDTKQAAAYAPERQARQRQGKEEHGTRISRWLLTPGGKEWTYHRRHFWAWLCREPTPANPERHLRVIARQLDRIEWKLVWSDAGVKQSRGAGAHLELIVIKAVGHERSQRERAALGYKL